MSLPIDSLFLAASQQIKQSLGGSERLAKVTLATASGVKLRLEVPVWWSGRAADAQPAVFIPNGFQQGVLKALEGRAMKTTALAAATGGDKPRLFRKGGIKELIQHGRVKHIQGEGYYRPDKPPPEIAAVLAEDAPGTE